MRTSFTAALPSPSLLAPSLLAPSLLAASLFAVGCGDTVTAPGPAPAGTPISYEIQSRGRPSVVGTAAALDLPVPGGKLETRDGRVFLNGTDRGPVQPGGSVLLTADGRLLVDGEER